MITWSFEHVLREYMVKLNVIKNGKIEEVEAIAARFLAQGKIKAKGIVAPENAISGSLYEEFIAELKKRNISILEE